MRRNGANVSRKTKRQGPPQASPSLPTACVGIGASSQGVEALRRLIAALPPDTGAAFVVALRLDNGCDVAALVRQLAARSPMPVAPATDGAALERNKIWVGGAGELTTVELGRLRVAPVVGPTDGQGAVDSLLISITEAYQEAAVVIVLAGLGSHGTSGVAATKRCGGLALAEVEGAPREPAGNAITAASIADLSLPVDRMPRELATYITALAATEEGGGRGQTPPEEVGQQLGRIAAILRNATGNDFHGYKHATFLRRIERRMQVLQIDDSERYIERLRSDASEIQHLFQDLLIGVTQFFRDPKEFEIVEREVVPALFEGRGAGDHIRIWVLGCATGEEAYSLAMLLREHMATLESPPHVQIFATDIDARALAVARAGRYAESIAKEVAPERLARWFVKEGATYSVVKELREMCIFSPHNLVRDAPFSRIDLLSCRNLLIYLNGELQDRVTPIFHFSLRPGGYLFLGPAENVSRHQKLFAPIDRKNRIFRRLETASRAPPDFHLSPRAERLAPAGDSLGRHHPPQPLAGRIGRRVDQIAERYAPAYVVIDENEDVVHFSGRTGRFLEPAPGTATLSLLNLVHRDLRLDLRTALHTASTQGRRVEARNVRLGANGDARQVNIIVEPIAGGPDEASGLFVLFQDAGPAGEAAPGVGESLSTDENVLRLEAELRLTKDRLQTTIEELESTNEELKASNEEYQSINEELQSANEELETSKEELQAVNEELQTVNGELAHRVGELGRANSDLKNLLESTQIATIFLDNDLRLRTFTPAASDIFHVIESDVGRPIAHISPRVAYPELQGDVRKVAKSLGQVEREVSSLDEDRQFVVRVLPYRSVDNFIAGVVVTFLEITGTAHAEAALRASERRFGEAQQLAGIGVWEWNLEGDENWWSPVTYRLWGLPAGDSPPPIADRRVHPEDRDRYAAAFEAARASGELTIEVRVLMPDGSIRWIAETGHMGRASQGRRMLGVTQDITERKTTETRLTLLLGELQHRVRNILGVVRSIVSRSVRNATSIEDLAAHLDGRLDNLARTQGIFTRTGESALDLEEIVRDEMLSLATHEDQVTVEGPQVRLKREAAETFALALHELATNAVKYGALSGPTGKLSVRWRLLNTNQGPKLSLEWRESGVKALDAQPSRMGFGRELLERGLPYELGATTSVDFARGGVRALIELPLNDKIAALDKPSRRSS